MMEIVASSELEQSEFGKACQSLHSEASSLLDQVTLEWKDHEARLQELNLKEMSVNQSLHEVQLKEKDLDSRSQKLESKQREVEQRADELNVRDKRVDERLNEVQLMEKHVHSLSQRLQRKEREIERQTKELESKRKHFKSQVKIEQLEHENDESSTNMDGSSLLLFMNEQLKKIDLAGSRMSAVLQASADPGKLVLDAVRGFYPSNPTVDNLESESNLRSIRKSCILLLQELKRMSPQIDLKVRVEAMKLAVEWKDKMALAIENSWEVLGFLRLIAAYGCTGICDAGELQSLLAMVEQPEQATELSRALGITDEVPGTNINSSIVKIEGPGDDRQTGKTAESSMARNAAILSSPNYSLPNEMLASLRLSSDPAKLVLNLIQRSFTQYWTNGDVSSKERVVSSNISLLKLLMGVSKHVEPHLKEDATNLASQWKAKMTADSENSLESLGFLLFTSIYGLLSTLNEDEIVKLLGRICQHKRSLELCQTHGFAVKIADFIGRLIEKNKLIEAVRSLCSLKLNDKFPTVPLLKAYVEDAKKWSEVICSLKISLAEKDKAVNGKIADLRAVSQCIKDYNLESEYPSKTVEMQIVQLEILKENWSSLAPSLVSDIEQQEERKRKRPNTSSSAPKFQLGQRRKIRFVCGATRP